MSDALHFDVELGDLVSGPAHKAAQAVDDLSNEMEKAKGKLAFFEGQLKLADKLGDVAGHDKYSAAVQQSTQKVFDLGNALGDAKDQMGGASAGLEEFGAAAGPAGTAVLALAAAVTVVIGTLYELGKAGIETALEVVGFNTKMDATFQALGKGPAAGEQTLGMLDEMSNKLPQTREEFAKWTREIQKMGVTDVDKVRQELLATASAQALLGDAGDAAYTKISRKVNDAIEGHHKLTITSKELTRTIGTNLADAIATKMGMSLEDLEKKLKAGTVDAAKFGDAMETTFIEKGSGALGAMWMQAGAITGKLKEQFKELFSGVDVSPLTDAMRGLLELFDQANPSGQVMKATFTDVFNSLVKGISWAIVEGEVLFLELEVLALSAELQLRPVVATIQKIGEAARVVTEPIRGLKAAFDYFTADEKPPPGAEPAPVAAAKLNPIEGLASALDAPSNDVGVAVGQGIVKGMVSMMGAVDAAGQDLGGAAVKGAKTGAGAHSPSVFAIEIGGNISEGLALGMVNSPMPAAAGRQISGSALGGASKAIGGTPANGNGGGMNISGLTIHITAPQGVTDATALSASALVIAVERLQLASGR